MDIKKLRKQVEKAAAARDVADGELQRATDRFGIVNRELGSAIERLEAAEALEAANAARAGR